MPPVGYEFGEPNLLPKNGEAEEIFEVRGTVRRRTA
jgi:hypothetical protein